MTTIIVRAVCPHDCPDTCAMLVTVQDGVATEVRGDPNHPTTAGVLCIKVSRYPERAYHKDRLLHPMKRIKKKGEGKFMRLVVWIATTSNPIQSQSPFRFGGRVVDIMEKFFR